MKMYLKKAMISMLAAGIIVGNANISSNQTTVYAHNIKIQNANEYIIAQDGTGDYCTIQEGVNNAKNGDTLIIYPGIYAENVEVMGKDINITGIDKNTCILQCDTASYRKAPLTIAAGKVSNLTIYGINSGIVPEQLTDEEIAVINSQIIGDSWERQKNYSGYAVHVDQNCLYQNEIIFENCKIISENNHCVGMGSRGKSSIIFDGCELISLGSGGCIYLHDCTSLQICGKADFVMRNCQLISYLSPYVMTIQSLMPANTTYFTFQNVRVSAVAYEDKTGYDITNMNTSFEVDILSQLDKTDQLEKAGLTSTVMHQIVHELTPDESTEYMKELEMCEKSKNTFLLLSKPLPEGITYICSNEKKTSASIISNMMKRNAKCQVISIFNADGLIGNGWCGLNNAYLTPDSYGNTLVEMNTLKESNQNMIVADEFNGQDLPLASH